jgi:hypothetical protein
LGDAVEHCSDGIGVHHVIHDSQALRFAP